MKRPFPPARLALAALVAGSLAAGSCDSATAPTPEDQPPTVAAMTLVPSDPLIEVGERLRLRAVVLTADGDTLAHPVGILWTSSDSTVAAVSQEGDVVGRAPGTAEIRATLEGVSGAALARVQRTPPPEPMAETRALWITRFDWRTEADLRGLVQRAAQAGFNTLYLQVRGRADAFYRSAHEPWAQRLTGTLGQDPGWDPLAAALDEAAVSGVEVHAWINAFIGWCGSAPPVSEPRHILVAHPDWRMADRTGTPMAYGGGCVWLTPGAAGVRTRLARVAADIARSYRVAGVHLDFIRFPDANHSWDPHTLVAYDSARAADPALTFAELRRRLVTAAVRETRDSLAVTRPSVELSAAVWGIYRNLQGWSGVSTGMEDRLQDARAWTEAGLVDVLSPMVYWSIKPTYGERLDFAWLVDEHVAAVQNRHVVVGLSAEYIGLAELERQILRSRQAGAAGVAVLSARLLDERGWWDALGNGVFARDAVPTPMPWRGQTAPTAVAR